jgi:hypothetical protein
MASKATPVPPTSGMASLPVLAVMAMTTPDPRLVMWRAAALVVRKWDRNAVSTGRVKSSSDISSSGRPCRSSRPTALKQTSMPPALAATSSAWASTARSSSASTSAVSTAAPAPASSAATSSRVARVRPARKTLAPSRAKAAATARPTDPAPPWTTAFLPSSSMLILPLLQCATQHPQHRVHR